MILEAGMGGILLAGFKGHFLGRSTWKFCEHSFEAVEIRKLNLSSSRVRGPGLVGTWVT